MGLNIRRQDKPILSRLSILLYGESKVGKTTTAAQFPEPLILSCEPHGTDLLYGVDVVDVRTLDDLTRIAREVAQTDYTTVVLDGLTSLVNTGALAKASPDAQGRQLRGELVYREVTSKVQTALSAIFVSSKMIVCTGHARTVKAPTAANKDRVEIMPDLNPALAQDIVGMFSVVCYCYPARSGSEMRTKPFDDGVQAIKAGDRTGALPVTMPLRAELILQHLRRFYAGAGGEGGQAKSRAASPVNGAAGGEGAADG